MTNPLVTAFVITCNRKDSLARALRSLLASDYPRLELLVVDNGSTDGTVEILANDFPQVGVIRNDTNLGTCVAHNQGVKEAQGTYVIRVDDDVALAPDCISTLVNVMEQDETIGISGPKLYLGGSNALWCVGGAIDWRNLDTVTLGEGEADRGQYDTMREVDYIGCCMFVRRSVYDDIGLIDERFFIYFEDVDFNVRVHRHGSKIVYVPSAKGYHHITPRKGSLHSVWRFNRNRFVFFRRYMPLPSFAAAVLRFAFFRLPGRALKRLRG